MSNTIRIEEQTITTVALRNSNVDTRGLTVYLYLVPLGGGLADRVEVGNAAGAASFVGTHTDRKVIRANSAPALRDDGSALVEGDGWMNTANRDKQYIWESGAWVLAQIDIPADWSAVGAVGKYDYNIIADPAGTPIVLATGQLVVRNIPAL